MQVGEWPAVSQFPGVGERRAAGFFVRRYDGGMSLLSFWRTIEESPTDEAPRRVFLDWLIEEEGREAGERAAALAVVRKGQEWQLRRKVYPRYNKRKDRWSFRKNSIPPLPYWWAGSEVLGRQCGIARVEYDLAVAVDWEAWKAAMKAEPLGIREQLYNELEVAPEMRGVLVWQTVSQSPVVIHHPTSEDDEYRPRTIHLRDFVFTDTIWQAYCLAGRDGDTGYRTPPRVYPANLTYVAPALSDLEPIHA